MSADRRTFLAGLAATALPVSALAPSAEAVAQPTSRPTTVDDLASADFEAVADGADLARLRETFDSHWTSLALAYVALTKDSRDLPGTMAAMDEPEDASKVAFGLMERVKATEGWFRETADVMHSAHTRMLCAMARLAAD